MGPVALSRGRRGPMGYTKEGGTTMWGFALLVAGLIGFGMFAGSLLTKVGFYHVLMSQGT